MSEKTTDDWIAIARVWLPKVRQPDEDIAVIELAMALMSQHCDGVDQGLRKGRDIANRVFGGD